MREARGLCEPVRTAAFGGERRPRRRACRCRARVRPLFDDMRSEAGRGRKTKINLIRDGKQESLLVRMSPRRNAEGALEGYVVAFDDVTDLVSAQRMAAWGDVARRIAHEIKNPLTPIQLSAERIKRKFSQSGRRRRKAGADDRCYCAPNQ